MSSFTEKLSATKISDNPRRWRLDEDFIYHVGDEDSDYSIMVKKGFICDGGTIFRAVWWLDSPMGDGAQAYFLHDALCASELVSRKEADMILKEALAVLPVGWARRRIIYRFCRMFGWIMKRSHTTESVAEARKFVTVIKPKENKK